MPNRSRRGRRAAAAAATTGLAATGAACLATFAVLAIQLTTMPSGPDRGLRPAVPSTADSGVTVSLPDAGSEAARGTADPASTRPGSVAASGQATVVPLSAGAFETGRPAAVDLSAVLDWGRRLAEATVTAGPVSRAARIIGLALADPVANGDRSGASEQERQPSGGGGARPGEPAVRDRSADPRSEGGRHRSEPRARTRSRAGSAPSSSSGDRRSEPGGRRPGPSEDSGNPTGDGGGRRSGSKSSSGGGSPKGGPEHEREQKPGGSRGGRGPDSEPARSSGHGRSKR